MYTHKGFLSRAFFWQICVYIIYLCTHRLSESGVARIKGFFLLCVYRHIYLISLFTWHDFYVILCLSHSSYTSCSILNTYICYPSQGFWSDSKRSFCFACIYTYIFYPSQGFWPETNKLLVRVYRHRAIFILHRAFGQHQRSFCFACVYT